MGGSPGGKWIPCAGSPRFQEGNRLQLAPVRRSLDGLYLWHVVLLSKPTMAQLSQRTANIRGSHQLDLKQRAGQFVISPALI